MRAARVLVAAACVALAANAAMSITVVPYTDETLFKAQLVPGYYLEDFNYDPWRAVEPRLPATTFTGGDGWTYEISAPDGLSGQPMPNSGGAVAPYRQAETLTVTFIGTKKPTAVGGIFWVTDINGNFLDGREVTITLSGGGTYTYNDTSNWDAFTGFVSDSPISSMTLTASGNWATMDHLYVGNVIPEPVTILSGFLAISGLGVYLRKRTRV